MHGDFCHGITADMNIAKQNDHGQYIEKSMDVKGVATYVATYETLHTHYTQTQKICYNLIQYDEYDILFIIKFYRKFI